MILPATARANDGYCMPCVHKRRREEHEEYIRRNRREVDPYAGITDVVEIIRVMHTRRPNDPLVVYRPGPKSAEELYSELNTEQAARLMTMAAEAMFARDHGFAEAVAESLATLTDFSLDEMLEAWVESNCFWPPVIFRGAGPKMRDAVIKAAQSKTVNRHHARCALAWIGDGGAQDFFREWEGEALSLRPEIVIGSNSYTRKAAWELEGNRRRDLFHAECWAITPGDRAADAAIDVMGEADQSCPWCKRRLVHLIELNVTDERFTFLNFNGEKLRILTCEACTCFGFMFSRISADGSVRLADESKRPVRLPEDSSSWAQSPWKGQAVQLHRRRAIHAVDWCMPVTVSQVGGLPSWVQSAEFPKCPDCSKTMTFVAQVDNGHFPTDEGVYYAFLCTECRTAATGYQQT